MGIDPFPEPIMGALEYFIWHLLGYSAMPLIFIIGFVAVALVCLPLLRLLGDRDE